MNLKVGKYYTLDIEEFIKYNQKKCRSNYLGISPEEIDIFKKNKPHKCLFFNQRGDTSDLFFEGQSGTNNGSRYDDQKYWEYYEGSAVCFKECNLNIQEEMEI